MEPSHLQERNEEIFEEFLAPPNEKVREKLLLVPVPIALTFLTCRRPLVRADQPARGHSPDDLSQHQQKRLDDPSDAFQRRYAIGIHTGCYHFFVFTTRAACNSNPNSSLPHFCSQITHFVAPLRHATRFSSFATFSRLPQPPRGRHGRLASTGAAQR